MISGTFGFLVLTLRVRNVVEQLGYFILPYALFVINTDFLKENGQFRFRKTHKSHRSALVYQLEEVCGINVAVHHFICVMC